MIECAETMVEEWKHHVDKELDAVEHFKVYTLDVISHTAFGSSYEQGRSFFQMLQRVCELSVRNGYKVRLPIIRYLITVTLFQVNTTSTFQLLTIYLIVGMQ